MNVQPSTPRDDWGGDDEDHGGAVIVWLVAAFVIAVGALCVGLVV
jgi:hypothetical protein